MNLKEMEYMFRHRLGRMTKESLIQKARKEGIFVHGDKLQILQCFDQKEKIIDLFKDARLR